MCVVWFLVVGGDKPFARGGTKDHTNLVFMMITHASPMMKRTKQSKPNKSAHYDHAAAIRAVLFQSKPNTSYVAFKKYYCTLLRDKAVEA